MIVLLTAISLVLSVIAAAGWTAVWFLTRTIESNFGKEEKNKLFPVFKKKKEPNGDIISMDDYDRDELVREADEKGDILTMTDII